MNCFEIDNPPGSDGGGDIQSIVTATDLDTGDMTFTMVITDDSDGFTLAINDGPNPKGHAGEMGLFYFDGTGEQPVVSAYAYNGKNTQTSWEDGSPESGQQAPDQIASSLADDSPFSNATVTIDDDGNKVMSFTVDADAIGDHEPQYPGPGGADDWTGADYGESIGMWLHPSKGLETSYDDNGFLAEWDADSQGWYDSANQPTELKTVLVEIPVEEHHINCFMIDNPPGSDGGGDIEHVAAEYDTTGGEMTFSMVITDDSDGFTLAINDGDNPKGHAGEMGLFYFDGTGEQPVVSVYAYNGHNAQTSWADGSPEGGTQAPDQIASSLADDSPFSDISITIDADGNKVMSFTVDADALGEHVPAYPGPDGAEEWSGAKFGDEIGIWLHPVKGLETSYDDNGFLDSWDADSQGWYDTAHQPTEEKVVLVKVMDDHPPVVDLDVFDTMGHEDTAIALDIDVGTSDDVINITVSDVPDGAMLSAGTDNGDGTWTLEANDLDGLTVTPPANSNIDFALNVSVTVTNGDETSTSTGIIDVDVKGVADEVDAIAQDDTGSEDNWIQLHLDSGVSVDTDGSEAITITISDVPEGARLNPGADNGDGTWSVSAEELPEVCILPAHDFSGEIDMTLNVTTTEDDGDTTTVSEALTVTVIDDDPVVTEPPVTEPPATAKALIIGIPENIMDAAIEGTEVVISGVPDGAAFSAGTDNGDGTWTIQPDDLQDLILSVPDGESVGVSLDISVIDSDGAEQTIVDSDLDHGADGFVYEYDAFGTDHDDLAWGAVDSQSLKVQIGGGNNDDVEDGMSGGFTKTFTVDAATSGTLTFSYRMQMDSEFEADEYGEVLASLDDALLDDDDGTGAILHQAGDGNGGSDYDSGRRTVEIDISDMQPGEHELTFGGFLNKKTYHNEQMEVCFDDILLVTEAGPVELANASVDLVPAGDPFIDPAMLFDFDGQDGSNDAVAAAAGDMDAALQNGADVTQDGHDGEGLSLDGQNDYLEVANDASNKPTEGALTMWINPDDVSGKQTLASSDSSYYWSSPPELVHRYN